MQQRHELVDTHCHLAEPPLAGATADVLARARQSGVGRILTVGTTLDDSRANVALARQHPGVRAGVGVHPNEAGSLAPDIWDQIEALAADPAVGAIGEVGLDFYRQTASPERQRDAFRGFIRLARRRRLPLAIHCRNAHDQLLAVLREEARDGLAGVIHCASGPPAFIEAAVAMGLHVSFAGNVTFPNAQAVRALVPLVPDDRLLMETDAPFLAPQPVRGRPNEPAYLAHTAAVVAQLRGVSPETLASLTSRNASRLFGFPA